jgi:hypothetical protein
VAADTPRYLHRHPAFRYTLDPSRAARGEPEALTDDELDELAFSARRREQATLEQAWRESATRIRDAVAHFTDHARRGDRLRSEPRAITRSVNRVGRRLGDRRA